MRFSESSLGRGQHWRLMNLEQRTMLLSMKHVDCLEYYFFTPRAERLVWMLAEPRQPKPYQRSVERGHSTNTRDLGALDLPYDVLANIFYHIPIEDIRDAVFLALTNTYLREIGQRRVYGGMVQVYGMWNLQRLICVGEYLDGDDLPEARGVIKAHEEETFRGDMSEEEVESKINAVYCDYLWYPRDHHGQYTRDDDGASAKRVSAKLRKRYRHRSRLYHTVADSFLKDEEMVGWWRTQFSKEATRGLSPTERRELRSLVHPDFSWDGRPETEWVLCSWTRAEYVRASAVAKLTGSSCKGPWTSNRLSLGHVLLTQICWSSDASDIPIKHNRPITRGRWAGHHVAIVTVDQLAEHHVYNVQSNWEDVTDEVLEEVLEIWRLNDPRTLTKDLRPEGKTWHEDLYGYGDSSEDEGESNLQGQGGSIKEAKDEPDVDGKKEATEKSDVDGKKEATSSSMVD